MFRSEYEKTREDGEVIIKTWDDEDYYIYSLSDGKYYEVAYDLKRLNKQYEETEYLIENGYPVEDKKED